MSSSIPSTSLSETSSQETPKETGDPASVTAGIRMACAVAFFQGAGMLLRAVFRLLSPHLPDPGFGVFLTVLLIWGLGFGVYKRSRACAIVLLVLAILGAVTAWLGGEGTSIWILIVFVAYGAGVQATFQHHKLRREGLPSTPEASQPSDDDSTVERKVDRAEAIWAMGVGALLVGLGVFTWIQLSPHPEDGLVLIALFFLLAAAAVGRGLFLLRSIRPHPHLG